MRNLFKNVARDQRGLSTMEYAVLFVIIIVGALTMWGKLGTTLSQKITKGQEKFDGTLGEAEDRAK